MATRTKMPEPYRLADRTAKLLISKTQKRLDESKRKLTILNFDEINALKEVIRLYKKLYEDCRKAWEQLYRDRYEEMWIWLKGKKPDEDEIDELVEMEFARLLYDSHPVTRYVFDAEVIRKRDRLWEDIEASPTKAQKQLAMDRHIRFWTQMSGWYTDFASQDAELEALKKAGVKRVKWNIYGDDRVCKTCRDLDGKIFPIDRVPEKPHVRCRCYLTPVK